MVPARWLAAWLLMSCGLGAICAGTSDPECFVGELTPPDGFADVFEVANDGSHVVYVAFEGWYHLRSVPIDGGAPTNLFPAAVSSIVDFDTTPDGVYVIYIVKDTSGTPPRLGRVPVAGGPSVTLSPPSPGAGGVHSFTISPDGLFVVFRAALTSGQNHLYSVSTAGGAVTQLDDIGEGVPGNVVVSPDSSRVVFSKGFQDTDVYSVPITGGLPVKLNGEPVGGVVLAVSADSSRAVFSKTGSKPAIFSVPIEGGTSVQIHPTLPSGTTLSHWSVTPDSSRVIFTTYGPDPEPNHIYSAAIEGGQTVDLDQSGTLATTRFVLVPGGSTVCYRRTAPDSTVGLWCQDVTGGIATRVSGDDVDYVYDRIRAAPGGEYLVYAAITAPGDGIQLYSVHLETGDRTVLNAPLGMYESVDWSSFLVSPAGGRVAYLTDHNVNNLYELFSVAIEGGSIARLNHQDRTVAFTLSTTRFSPDGERVVYAAWDFPPYYGLYSAIAAPAADDPTCDGLDDDCDGSFDEDSPVPDLDGDGFCFDCDDGNAAVYPGAAETCDTYNNDCRHPEWPDATGLETDDDGDGVPECAGDCDDDNATVLPGMVEVNDGIDNQCPGDPGFGIVDELSGESGFFNPESRDEYSWSAQTGATVYEAARLGGVEPFLCVLLETTGLSWSDPGSPDPGEVFYYLSRAAGPHPGSWGLTTDLEQRVVVFCLAAE